MPTFQDNNLESSHDITFTIPMRGLQYDPDVSEFPEEWSQFLGNVAPFSILNPHKQESMHRNKYIGKRSVLVSILVSSIRLPSNYGREIYYKTPEANKTTGSFAEFRSQSLDPDDALGHIYYQTLPRYRSWADWTLIFNYPINLVAVTLEIGAKTLAAMLTQPFHRCMMIALNLERDKKPSAGLRVAAAVGAFVSLIPWAIAQAVYTVGNVLSYARKITDGVANVVSRFCASFTGNQDKYPSYRESFKTIGKNLLLTLGGGIPLFSGLFHFAIIKIRNYNDRQAAKAAEKADRSPVSSTAKTDVSLRQHKPARSPSNKVAPAPQKSSQPAPSAPSTLSHGPSKFNHDHDPRPASESEQASLLRKKTH